MGDASDPSSFESRLVIPAVALRPDDVAWNCYVIGWTGPENWLNGDVREEVPYAKFASWNPDADFHGAPNGTLLFWCRAVDPGEATSFAIELHIRSDEVPGELSPGRIWLKAPTPPGDVTVLARVALSGAMVKGARQRLDRANRPGRVRAWVEGVLGITPPGNTPG